MPKVFVQLIFIDETKLEPTFCAQRQAGKRAASRQACAAASRLCFFN
jgi:hypothetical protein